MQRRSPPKHRHDGTSPLPLGMDWSPPPRKWNGQETVWPHDFHTGWSYCVTIPSWAVLPKSRDSDPVVFYRVQIGIQSPEGITTTRGVLRRFNDFLKLFTDLKKAFPKKSLPPAPPKGLLRLKSRALLEERRCSLEEWMAKLLSDIDLSRSVAVASFLELEAAARSSFQDINESTSEANAAENSTILSSQVLSQQSLPPFAGTSSIMSDYYGSDTAYEASELGTPSLGRDDNSELGLEELTLDEDLTGPIEKFVKYGMTNIDEGLSMGQTILDQLEGFPRHKAQTRNNNDSVRKDPYVGNGSRASFLAGNGLELFSEPEVGKAVSHARKLSNESVGSDISSLKGSEMSNSGVPNLSGDGSLGPHGSIEDSSITVNVGNPELQFSGDAQIVLPLDQRHKMNRVLLAMQRRLVTAKTDMEDLMARLYQEIAVKDYLAAKVNDLEVELETTKQKSKENLQLAILDERERFTKMQWEMEELRRKSLEMELKLHTKQSEKPNAEPTEQSAPQEKDVMLHATKEQLDSLSRKYEELEAKSKADIKVLIKEVKSLRNSQRELNHELSQTITEKSETEELLKQERQISEHARSTREKLLSDCRVLYNQLLECNLNLSITDDEDSLVDSSSLADALNLLTTSDNKISLLLAEAEVLAKDGGANPGDIDRAHENDEAMRIDDELRKLLANIFINNAKLRKQVNSLIRHRLNTGIMSSNNTTESSESLERRKEN
ncbi:hypothetical protein SLEP1_g1716 [Rubroshorea leprosula]|uniref:PX domain-containing protein n=1 Tax=Rubroshorea leprosula TaxID=152421 RepID=A0AAV5HEQ3_9ROSI|nr:hypothetical protein SLEP1_g1716 [Rubroshorea leprosula]